MIEGRKVNIQKEIRSVLQVQASAILAARRHIGPAFDKAVREIYRCKGKVVVTGIGKSGLIAQKIASTLSSTGTSAIYLHPVEGMHGNLGVLHRNDIVIAIGKSGESEEILNILPAIKRIGARVVSLTARKDSSLARQSSIVLHVPVDREACPLNLAPTTSSTIALVVGDAIAIALMKIRGFKAENFALLHPGGLLGKRLLLRVSDVMRSGRRNPVVKVDDTMMNLLVEISRKWTGAANVVDRKGRLVGLVTDFDIRQAFARGWTMSTLSIRQIMNAKPTAIRETEMAIKAFEVMESRKKPFTVLPVVDAKRRSVGMLHLHDLVTAGLAPDTGRA
ncbi:MAG: KpsF/GutQ family sugar-phosphate isomerase [Elusimicrobia bacterium]|nr:KpsF/GutQ family sugar-phosphate isomerase [Elusimicrobiota bacterium]